MPTWTNIKTETLEDFQIAFNNYMRFFTKHLNSKNVQRLDTNETVIKSADGSTEIAGPILIQKDGAGTTRIMQGYDAATDTFIYALFNASGAKTVGIDSTGDATFTGDITGSTITGGTVRTAAEGNARIELTGAGLTSYSETDGQTGISIVTGDFGFSDLQYYDDAELLVGGLNYDSLGNLVLYTLAGASIRISPDTGANCYIEGNVDFGFAESIDGLKTGSAITDGASHYHNVILE